MCRIRASGSDIGGFIVDHFVAEHQSMATVIEHGNSAPKRSTIAEHRNGEREHNNVTEPHSRTPTQSAVIEQ